MPELVAGMYLVDILFRVGPIRGDMPLVEENLEPWERRRGIQLAPWQADLVLEMSQEYLRQLNLGRQVSASSPWPKARKMWKYVMDQKHAKEQVERKDKEQEPNGTRKRYRNTPPG